MISQKLHEHITLFYQTKEKIETNQLIQDLEYNDMAIDLLVALRSNIKSTTSGNKID